MQHVTTLASVDKGWKIMIVTVKDATALGETEADRLSSIRQSNGTSIWKTHQEQ